ncbi:zinc knuckle [Ancylostoma ceylanicum]|uniref:Zinc knuckle n=1 Tax=Ancylostoma ceylanicum TaxID=53326 RepID=A0A0D6LFZ3_9BILA|nr:zinc knuckle [Ancylostoma ceylanicum]
MVDSIIDSVTEDQEKQTIDYIDSAHDSLDRAQAMAIQLEAKRLCAREQTFSNGPTAILSSNLEGTSAQIGIAQPKLPAIPIPIFTGKIWEFANFWTLFEANVHTQPLTKLQKFNYLVSALRGEARETIRRYPISEDNYDNALALLRKKYGDESKLISGLQYRLESAKAEKHTIPAQRRLLECIIPLVAQLQKRGVNLDGSFTAQKILSKFSVPIQRRMLESRIRNGMAEQDWKLDDLLNDLDHFIATEERINGMVNNDATTDAHSNRDKPPRPTPTKTLQITPPCLFCNSKDHRALLCPKYATIAKRRAFFEANNKCFNCARDGHSVKDCTGVGCRFCDGKKHHHTLCPNRAHGAQASTNQAPTSYGKRFSHNPPQSAARSPKTSHSKHVSPRVHQVQACNSDEHAPIVTEGPAEDTTILHSTNIGKKTVLLLTGVARVLDSMRNRWKDVEILFDTGADQSFISDALANELELECTPERGLMMYTFGSNDPKPTKCATARLELMDLHGQKHQLQLCT